MIRNKDISEDYSDGYHNGFKTGKINGYTTRNDEVQPALTALQNIVDYLDGNPTHKIHPDTSLHAEAKLALTKLKEDKK